MAGRRLGGVAVVAVAAGLLAGASGSAASSGHVRVYFLYGEQLVRVTRSGRVFFRESRPSRPSPSAFQTPNVPVPVPPPPRLKPPDPHVKQIQQRLIKLGYLLRGAADGRLGPVTEEGILAFQKWERLARTGSLNARTESRLAIAARPEPISPGGAEKRERPWKRAFLFLQS